MKLLKINNHTRETDMRLLKIHNHTLETDMRLLKINNHIDRDRHETSQDKQPH